MKKSSTTLVLLIGITLLSVTWGAQCALSEPSETAPDFSLSTINGEILKLSDFKGKVIILDFWAMRCPPCRKEIPDFIKLYNKYKDKELVIIGVSLDRDLDRLKTFCHDMGINYPIVIGTRELTETYGGIMYIPTTFVIDKNGNIVNKHIGFTEKEVFEEEIKAFLKQ